MPVVNIEGVPIKFPFVPYGVQKDYMKNVIKSLDQAENAVLESPTGLSYIPQVGFTLFSFSIFLYQALEKH